jgi:hypothetical protein
MKTSQQSNDARTLTRRHWDVPIRVRLVPYVEFSHWLDEELERLVDLWWDHAAPCARKRRPRG